MSATSNSALRWIAIALLVLLLLPAFAMALAMPMMGVGWWMVGPGGTGTVPLAMLVGWGVVLVVFGVLGYALYRMVAGTERTDPALEELRLAYARGDLTDEEFERRREALEEDAHSQRS